MNGRILGLAAVALIAVMTLAVLGTWRFARATGPDVDNSGKVTISDILSVVHAYGQTVPTPTPRPQQTSIELALDKSLNGCTSSYCNLHTVFHVDTARYPADSEFRLELAYESAGSPVGSCVRIASDDDESYPVPVANSEICAVGPQDGFVESAPLSMPAGSHLYTAQWLNLDSSTLVGANVRLLVSWVE